jgi:hypothetical protein
MPITVRTRLAITIIMSDGEASELPRSDNETASLLGVEEFVFMYSEITTKVLLKL